MPVATLHLEVTWAGLLQTRRQGGAYGKPGVQPHPDPESDQTRASDEYRAGEFCCLACPGGYRVHRDCTATLITLCSKCPDGTFKEDLSGQKQCSNCTKCVTGQKEKKSCTPTSDAECEIRDGFFCSESADKDTFPEATLSCQPHTISSGGGNSVAALQLSSGSTIPFSAGLPLRPRRQSGGGDMEEKGIALPELSCRTGAEVSAAVRQLRRCTPGAELPPKLCGCSGGCTPGAQLRAPHAGAAGLPPRPTPSGPASFGGSPAAPARGARRQVRQLSSRSAIPFSSMLRFMDFRESMPKFLSPNSSQPWLRYPRLRVFICCGSTRDVRRSLYDS
ncbi:unnamed protein product [Boreogadus saida]